MGVCFAAALLAVGCGKKGPPLAPIVRIPAAIETVETQRVGDDAYVTVTVPTKNVDMSTPVDVAKVQIYGYRSEEHTSEIQSH